MRQRNNGGDWIKDGVAVAFIGQVNTKVQGKVEKGDYIMAADGNGIGKAVRPENIAGFTEFKRVVGTAWESKGDGIGKVLVAVGVK